MMNNDIVFALQNIASKIGEASSHDIDHLYSVVSVIIGIFLTLLVQNFTKWNSNKDEKELLIVLLGDEIKLRWHMVIAAHLRKILETDNEEDQKRLFLHTSFRADDLYVFEHLSNNFRLSTVLGDKKVVSHIVYIHILAKDFQQAIENFKDKYTKHQAQSSNFQNSEVVAAWKYLKEQFEKLDCMILEIFLLIHKSYRIYADDTDSRENSEFINEIKCLICKIKSTAAQIPSQ